MRGRPEHGVEDGKVRKGEACSEPGSRLRGRNRPTRQWRASPFAEKEREDNLSKTGGARP